MNTATQKNAVSNAYIDDHKHIDNNTKKQKKRRRIVKNEIVTIDDIDDLPGDNFINWIEITKQKLIEREKKLMSIRVNLLQNVINEQVENFKQINDRMKIYIDSKLYSNIITNELIQNCLNQLTVKLIDSWNGIVLNHTKHKLDCYRKYFTTSRSWFDQRKKGILAQSLWLPIFNVIVEFIKEAAKRYFNERFFLLQRKFVKSLTMQIITNIFKQKLKLPSTRPHSLISCSILKECHVFQMYMATNIDSSISINSILQKSPDMTAVTLMSIIIDALEYILNESLINFQNDVYQLYDEFNFVPVYVEPLTNYSQYTNDCDCKCDCNDNSGNREQQQIQQNNYTQNTDNNSIGTIPGEWDENSMIGNNYNNNNNNNNNNNYNDSIYNDDYNPIHFQSYSVTDQRFSPLI